MWPPHANIPKPILYDMLALRMEMKIQRGQIIQNVRLYVRIVFA